MLHKEAIAADTVEHNSPVTIHEDEFVSFRGKLQLLAIKRSEGSRVIGRVLHFIRSRRRRWRIGKRFACGRRVEKLDRVFRDSHRTIPPEVRIDRCKSTNVAGEVHVDRRAERHHATRMTQTRVAFNVTHPNPITIRRRFATIGRIDRGLCEQRKTFFRKQTTLRQGAPIQKHAHVLRHVRRCRSDTSRRDVYFEPLRFRERAINRKRFALLERFVADWEAAFEEALKNNYPAPTLDKIPAELNLIVEGSGLEVIRTPATLADLTKAAAGKNMVFAGAVGGGYVFPEFLPAYDAVASLANLLELLAPLGKPVSELVSDLPEPTLVHRRLACPWAKKGLVMRVLNERMAGRDVDLTDGIKILDERGWSQVLPDPDEPLVHLYAEGETPEASEELEHELRELVEEIMQGDTIAPRTSVEASS